MPLRRPAADDPGASLEWPIVEVQAPASVLEPNDLHHAEACVGETVAVLEGPGQTVTRDRAPHPRGHVGSAAASSSTCAAAVPQGTTSGGRRAASVPPPPEVSPSLRAERRDASGPFAQSRIEPSSGAAPPPRRRSATRTPDRASASIRRSARRRPAARATPPRDENASLAERAGGRPRRPPPGRLDPLEADRRREHATSSATSVSTVETAGAPRLAGRAAGSGRRPRRPALPAAGDPS